MYYYKIQNTFLEHDYINLGNISFKNTWIEVDIFLQNKNDFPIIVKFIKKTDKSKDFKIKIFFYSRKQV